MLAKGMSHHYHTELYRTSSLSYAGVWWNYYGHDYA